MPRGAPARELLTLTCLLFGSRLRQHCAIPEPLLEHLTRNADITATLHKRDFTKQDTLPPCGLDSLLAPRDVKRSGVHDLECYWLSLCLPFDYESCQNIAGYAIPATYLAASYRANLPKINSLQVVNIDTEWVRGEFDSPLKAREVFNYFRPPNAKQPEAAPTSRLQRVERIWRAFSALRRNGGHSRVRRFSASRKNCSMKWKTRRSLNFFSFTLYSWREIQQRFKRAIAAISSNRDGEDRPPQIHLHMPYSLSIQTVIAQHPDGLRPELRPTSLLSAFWLMLWMDASVKGIRVCMNEKCQREFRGTRSDRIYCRNECAVAVAKRKWWLEKGSAKRRQSQKSKRKKKR